MKANRLLRILTVLIPLAIAACSSAPAVPEFAASRVIERMGGKKETPAWATGETPIVNSGDSVIFVHSVSMSGDARPEVCVKSAEETGRAQMLRYIGDAITSAGQVSELSASSDPGVESLTAFFASGRLSGASVAARYWEKVEESDTSANRVLRLRCAAQIGIQKGVLEKQLRAALGAPQGNSQIREKLLQAQSDFIEGIGERKPSTSTSE